jgi:hypothetical protein
MDTTGTATDAVSMTTPMDVTSPPVVSKACEDHALNWKTLDPVVKKLVSKRLIVNTKYNLLYCPAPYHATSSWMKAMYFLSHEANNIYPSHNKVPAGMASNKSNHQFLSDFAPDEQMRIVHEYKKFLVVRHPLSRLAAVYQQKFQNKNPVFRKAYGLYIVQHYRRGAPPNPSGDDVQFSEFVHYLTATKDKRLMNEHWQPLEYLCQPCALHYDAAVHMETMETDATTMFEQFGLSSVLTAPPTTDWWEVPSSHYIQQLYSDLSPSLLAELVKHYKNDVTLFGYSARV